MRRLLHIHTRPAEVVAQMIEREQQQAGEQVVRVDLTDPSGVDYEALLDEILAADNVVVW